MLVNSQDVTTNTSSGYEHLSQSEINTMFEKELRMVYSEIDRNSDLLWSARKNSELIRFIGANGQRTRGNAKCTTEEPERETNATFGYGEITKVSQIKTSMCNIPF